MLWSPCSSKFHRWSSEEAPGSQRCPQGFQHGSTEELAPWDSFHLLELSLLIQWKLSIGHLSLWVIFSQVVVPNLKNYWFLHHISLRDLNITSLVRITFTVLFLAFWEWHLPQNWTRRWTPGSGCFLPPGKELSLWHFPCFSWRRDCLANERYGRNFFLMTICTPNNDNHHHH